MLIAGALKHRLTHCTMPISCSKCHFLFLIQDKPKLTKPQLARSLALSRSLAQLYNPTPLTHQLSLHVLLASDPAREEMFCLILKCEVSCQVSLVTDLFGRGGEKKKEREKKKRAGRKKMFVLHETAEPQSCDQS